MNTKRFLNAWNNFKIDWKKSLWSKLHIWFLLFLLSLCFRLTLNIHVTRMLQQNQFSCERFLFGNWISVKSVQIIFLIYIFFLFFLDHTRWNETFKRQNESTHFSVLRHDIHVIFLCDLWTLMAVSLKDEPDRNVIVIL